MKEEKKKFISINYERYDKEGNKIYTILLGRVVSYCISEMKLIAIQDGEKFVINLGDSYNLVVM